MPEELAALTRNKTRTDLIAAYTRHRNGEPGAVDSLMTLVRKFALVKLLHLEFDFKHLGTAETADDWAQDVCLSVWKGLETFEGSPESFYAWVHRIAYIRGTDAFNYLKGEQDIKAPMFVTNEDEDGTKNTEENPAMYSASPAILVAYDERDKPRVDPPSCPIPFGVQGIDRSICRLILAGMNYAQIAECLEMKEDSVKQRMKRLKDRLANERTEATERRKAVA